jgi:predicted nucleic acid-binding protein
MMESRLSNSSRRIVADTSAIINLNGTRRAADILRAMPDRLIVVDIAAGELDVGRKTGRSDADMLAELERSGLLDIDSLGGVGEAIFESLVLGSAVTTLDDGEAATIAYAVENSLSAIVDEKKARRICRERFGSLPLLCSVELLQHPTILTALGKDGLSAALLEALKVARMRVMPEHIDWIVKVIGDANARACTSIPKREKQARSRNQRS